MLDLDLFLHLIFKTASLMTLVCFNRCTQYYCFIFKTWRDKNGHFFNGSPLKIVFVVLNIHYDFG